MLRFLLYLSISVLSFFGLAAALASALLLSVPRPDDIKSCLTAKMHNVRLCPTEASYVPLKSISPHIRNAVIVSEDAGFYGHGGIDFHELRMSFEENLRARRFARGGSTITQQLAKNVYLSGEKSLLRKAREALIAVQIEKILSKDEILEKYLNVVEFGPDIYGVMKATEFYFGKAPHEVTVLEGAWLAFLLPNPSQYSTSFRKRELTRFARHQLKVIVQRMARYGRISIDDEAIALAQLENMFRPAEEALDDGMNDPDALELDADLRQSEGLSDEPTAPEDDISEDPETSRPETDVDQQ